MNEAQYTIFRSMVESFVTSKEKVLAEVKTRNETPDIQLALKSRVEGELFAYQQVLALLDTVQGIK